MGRNLNIQNVAVGGGILTVTVMDPREMQKFSVVKKRGRFFVVLVGRPVIYT